jgi:hypothetical protein
MGTWASFRVKSHQELHLPISSSRPKHVIELDGGRHFSDDAEFG